MPKGQKRDEQDKRDAVSQFEGLGGTPDAAKQTAADFGVKATTIRKWARSLNGKKAPKRKTARKADATWESLFSEYIEARNEANNHILKAKKSTAKMEAARKKLEAFVKGLK